VERCPPARCTSGAKTNLQSKLIGCADRSPMNTCVQNRRDPVLSTSSLDVCFGSRADIVTSPRHVRFYQSGIEVFVGCSSHGQYQTRSTVKQSLSSEGGR
jgi:hypothetical protein